MTDAITQKIEALKRRKNAVILAHNYQRPEIQDVADYVGDSLGLSLRAAETATELIVFCGVYFMAETAKILNPRKKVLMPDARAGCPMADMINGAQLQELRNRHPHAKVVCYINSTAEVKALSDICCTSGNAVEIVRSLGGQEIIFAPDQYLGSFIEEKLNRKMILWNGYCNIHTRIRPETLLRAKKEHPKALAMAHPECPPSVRVLADYVDSTSGMINFPNTVAADEFLVATESGLLHQLKKKYPGKVFYPAEPKAICPNMKLTTLEKLLWCLEDEQEEIFVETETARRAKRCLLNMQSAQGK